MTQLIEFAKSTLTEGGTLVSSPRVGIHNQRLRVPGLLPGTLGGAVLRPRGPTMARGQPVLGAAHTVLGKVVLGRGVPTTRRNKTTWTLPLLHRLPGTLQGGQKLRRGNGAGLAAHNGIAVPRRTAGPRDLGADDAEPAHQGLELCRYLSS